MSELTIRVDWTPSPALGVNAHTHWRRKHPDEQNAHETGKLAAKSTLARKRWECPDMPVLVAVIHWEKKSRKKDSDNALNAIKHLIDGVSAGLGINDRQFVTAMAFQRTDPEKRGFTEITIRPATKAERQMTA